MSPTMHAHPCNYRRQRHFDRGWGEIAFEYRWDATGGEGGATDDVTALAHCHIYEVTHYSGNVGRWSDGRYHPPDPPFAGWRLRDPTDGRTGPVGLECFPASQGWAWDRHKLAGALVIPPSGPGEYRIVATQSYRYFCDQCGIDEPLPGPAAGPHLIVRSFGPKAGAGGEVWRYSLTKHERVAWMDLGARGFVADSAGLQYGPFWTTDTIKESPSPQERAG